MKSWNRHIDQQLAIRAVLILLLTVVGLIYPYIYLFFIPGLLLTVIPWVKQISLSRLLIYCIGLSISFWMIAFWYLSYLPTSLTDLAIITTVISLTLLLYLLYRKTGQLYHIKINRSDLIVILIFISLLMLRLEPLSLTITPAGADMSMHTYITNLITDNNGVPDSYQPILNIQEFNTFPVGFHTLSAQISLADDLPGYRSVFIMSAITYTLLTIFLYIFLTKFITWPFALISAIAFTSLTQSPQGFIAWGGTPTVLALAMIILFAHWLHQLKRNRYYIIFAASALAATLLTHTVILVQSAYILGIIWLIYILLTGRPYQIIADFARICALTLILCVPYLISINYTSATDQAIKDWLKVWIRDYPHAWSGTVYDAFITIPDYIQDLLFADKWHYITILSIFGLVIAYFKTRTVFFQYLFFGMAIFGLILNTQYWLLPLSHLLYPERLAIMTIIPLSLFGAVTLQHCHQQLTGRHRYLGPTFIILLTLITWPFVLDNHNRFYSEPTARLSSVTEADYQAMRWLETRLEPEDLIQNNYGDGGLWLPSIIGQPITDPHINIAHQPYQPYNHNQTYIYTFIGSKCVYEEACLLQPASEKQKAGSELIYSQDGVYIFRSPNRTD